VDGERSMIAVRVRFGMPRNIVPPFMMPDVGRFRVRVIAEDLKGAQRGSHGGRRSGTRTPSGTVIVELPQWHSTGDGTETVSRGHRSSMRLVASGSMELRKK
jgi:hypothetical protein